MSRIHGFDILGLLLGLGLGTYVRLDDGLLHHSSCSIGLTLGNESKARRLGALSRVRVRVLERISTINHGIGQSWVRV